MIKEIQTGLFDNLNIKTNDSNVENHDTSRQGPLAYRARPKDFDEFQGQKHIYKRYPFIMDDNIPSMVIWGPPGTGKTTLANVIALKSSKELYRFSAVLGGVNDLKKLIARAAEMKVRTKKDAIIFIDEIHRFNKAQQDALLPYVEEGAFTLIGATTENPRVSVNKALLSRLHIVELKKLGEDDILEILKRAQINWKIETSSEVIEFIADYSGGDARNALNFLEIIEKNSQKKELGLNEVKKLILDNSREYDRNNNRHYDVISAFIKSLRGSDPDAALLWLAIMIDGGEDPVFIARRLVIFASEDVGNADPSALTLATSALTAVKNIGMPEARIILGQATSYLASTYKSNASYNAINQAISYVEQRDTIEVPDHLKNHPPKGTPPYKYPHNYPDHWVNQEYTTEEIPKFYGPTEMGKERFLKERLDSLRTT